MFRDILQFEIRKKKTTKYIEEEKTQNEHQEKNTKKKKPLEEYLTFFLFYIYCPFGKIYDGFCVWYVVYRTFNIFQTNLI